jgi:SRSO17 transposase/transposase
MVIRARIILLSADGESSGGIAKELGTCRSNVQKWRHRFAELGVAGIMQDAKRSGRPRKVEPDRIEELASVAKSTIQDGGKRWTVRGFAKAFDLPLGVVERMWKTHRIYSHVMATRRAGDDGSLPNGSDDHIERSEEQVDSAPPAAAAGDSSSKAPTAYSDATAPENHFERIRRDCAVARLPETLLNCLEELITCVVSLFDDSNSDSKAVSVNVALSNLASQIKHSTRTICTGSELGKTVVSQNSDRSLEVSFEEYLHRLCKVIGHADRHEPLRAYLVGLILPGRRKSVEPMAARIDPYHVQARHNSMHHFVAKAPWDEEIIIRVARNYALEHFGRHGGVQALVIDDTGIPKKGRHSVGVARQYCGVLGKTDNCQVAVSISLANEVLSVPAAYRLYLPESWANNKPRCKAAGVPEDIQFKTKWQIAIRLIKQLLADGVEPAPVLADAGYGNVTEFREALTELTMQYSVGILPSTSIWPPGMEPLPPNPRKARGRPPKLLRRSSEHCPVAVSDFAASLDKDAWQHVEWRAGTCGSMLSRFAAFRVRPAHDDDKRTEPRAVEWLLIEWPELEKEPKKYWLSNLADDISLFDLVRLTKIRWRIERDYQEQKSELGLDQYEGRNWLGFHHHGALCIAVHAFLSAERARLSPPGDIAFPQAPQVPEGFYPRGSPRADRKT